MSKSVYVPTSLGRAGKKLYREIASKWDLRPDEKRVLLDACAEADLVDELAKAMKGQPYLVRGSQGQQVINPMIAEQRQHRAVVASLLKQLRLPDEGDSQEARSSAARDAANARWHKRSAG